MAFCTTKTPGFPPTRQTFSCSTSIPTFRNDARRSDNGLLDNPGWELDLAPLLVRPGLPHAITRGTGWDAQTTVASSPRLCVCSPLTNRGLPSESTAGCRLATLSWAFGAGGALYNLVHRRPDLKMEKSIADNYFSKGIVINPSLSSTWPAWMQSKSSLLVS